MRTFSFIAGVAAAALGLVAAGAGWRDARVELLTSGSGVAIAGLSLIGLAAGLTTWKADRAKAREQAQRDVYGQLVGLIYGRFYGQYDQKSEGQLRAQVVVWGDAQIVQALQNWNSTYDKHLATTASGTVTLSDPAKVELTSALTQLVSAIRDQFGLRKASDKAIYGALFNQ